MKYLIHNDNYEFWIKACDKAIQEGFENLKRSVEIFESWPWWQRKLFYKPSLENDEIYEEFKYKFNKYKTAFLLKLPVCMSQEKKDYILNCANMQDEYMAQYPIEKDIAIYEI